MARDPKALSAVLRCCQRPLFAQLRRRGRALGIKDGRPAGITAIQVFGGALNLNVHFHVVVVDALFVVEGERLSTLQRDNVRLYRANLLEESFVDILDRRQPNVVKALLVDWLGWASRSRLPAFG